MSTGGSPGAGAVRAGGAFVTLELWDTPFYRSLHAVEGHLANFGAKMARMGRAMVTAAGAGVAIGSFSLKQWADVDKELAALRSAAGPTADQMTKVADAVMSISRTTGTGPAAVASAFTELIKAGTSVDVALGGAAESVVKFAKVSGMDAEAAAIVVSDALHIFASEGLSAAEAVNVLAAAADSSSVSLQQVSEAFSQTSAVAKQSGLSLMELSTAIAIMGNAGVKGSDAGTSLKMFLTRLRAPAQDAQEVIDRFNLKLRDSAGNLKEMPDLIDELNAKLGGLSQTEKDASLGELFGTDAIRPATILMEQGGKGFIEFSKQMSLAATVSEKFATVMGSTDGKLSQLWAAIQRISGEIGQVLSPVLDTVIGMVKSFENAIVASDSQFRVFVGKIATAVVTVGAIGVALLAAATAVKAVTLGIAMLNVVAGGFELIAKGLVATFYAITAHPIVAVITALCAVVLLAAAYFVDWNKVLERTAGLFGRITPEIGRFTDAARENSDTLLKDQLEQKNKMKRLAEIRSDPNRTEESFAEESVLVGQLKAAFPGLAAEIDKVGMSAKDTADAFTAMYRIMGTQQIDATIQKMATVKRELDVMVQNMSDAAYGEPEKQLFIRERGAVMRSIPSASPADQAKAWDRIRQIDARIAEIEAAQQNPVTQQQYEDKMKEYKQSAQEKSALEKAMAEAPDKKKSSDLAGRIAEAEREAKEWTTKQREALSRIRNERLSMIEDVTKREMESIKLKYEEERRLAKEKYRSGEKLARALGIIDAEEANANAVAADAAAKRKRDFEIEIYDRVFQARNGLVEDNLDRELAAINHKYDLEDQEAARTGKDRGKIQEARDAEIEAATVKEQRRVRDSNRDLKYQMDQEAIGMTMHGPARDKALLRLERDKALEEEKRVGNNPDVLKNIEALYALKLASVDVKSIRGTSMGSFNALGASRMGLGDNLQSRTAKATEESAKHLRIIAGKNGVFT